MLELAALTRHNDAKQAQHGPIGPEDYSGAHCRAGERLRDA